jgi:hypothetical protein
MFSFAKKASVCVMALCMVCISASVFSLAHAKAEDSFGAMEAVMKNVLGKAIEVAELENASIHRSLKQAFAFEGLEDSFFGGGGLGSSQDPTSGILELMQMGQNLMPKSVSAVDSSSGGGDVMASMLPMMMDPNFLGNLLSGGQVSEMASEACSPLVMASMNGGLSSLMFPPNVKEMYDGFCKMMNSGGGGFNLDFNSANVPMPKALGMLGPQITDQFDATTTTTAAVQKKKRGGSDLISSLLGLNTGLNLNVPAAAAVPVDPRGEFHSASVASLPAGDGVETFILPIGELNATTEQLMISSESSNVDQKEGGVSGSEEMQVKEEEGEEGEDATGMDYITGTPDIGMMMMPDLSEMMDFGAIFALEKSLPNVIDSFIDDAWQELGTEEQAYAAGHPLAQAAQQQLEEELEEEELEEGMVFQANSMDEETLSHILDNVALVIKGSSLAPKNTQKTPESVSFEIVRDGSDSLDFGSASDVREEGVPDVRNPSLFEEEEIARSRPEPTTVILAEKVEPEIQKERINTLSALFICAIFVALVAVAVSALSAYKFCSNNMNEKRYQQQGGEYDGDYPSERKLLRPRQMPSA